MGENRHPANDELVGRFLEALARRADGDEHEATELFRRALGGVAWEDLVDQTEEGVVGSLLSLWELGQRRTPGELRLRVYNPDEIEGGWASGHTAVDIVTDDMPFLLASVEGEIQRRQQRIHLLIHPLLGVRRTAEGKMVQFDEEAVRESWIHLEIDRETEGRSGLERLEADLRAVLGEVRVAVEHWQPMRQRVHEVLSRLEETPPPLERSEIEESKDFLRWLLDDHFTFLGHRHYDLVTRDGEEFLELDPDSALGLLQTVQPDSIERSNTPLPERLSSYLQQRELLIITKASRRSRVHRTVHMDSVGIRRFDRDGRVVGEERFVGLFTSRVYSSSALMIPQLRRKVARVEERAGFRPESHDGKLLAHILESFPRDELFQISEDDLLRMALGTLRLHVIPRVALFVRVDEFERFVSALVFVPRERYTMQLRRRMQAMLEQAFGGVVTALYTQMGDQPLARTHFIVKTTPGAIPTCDLEALEVELTEAARTWSGHLREHLLSRQHERRGLVLHRRYGEAFPPSYRERFKAKDSIPDIEVIEGMEDEDQTFEARLYRPPGSGRDEVHLKLYQRDRHIALSDALPILEHMGVRVEAEVPFEVQAEGRPAVWIHDFELRSSAGETIDYERSRGALEEALRRVWSGEMEDGSFNRLVLASGLDWRAVVVLRAYSRYLRQTGLTFSQRYMADTLVSHAPIARRLVELFEVLFDPEHREGFRSRAAGALAAIRQALDQVGSLDEDRILRAFLVVIKATLRTNAYQRNPAGERKPYLSFKLDSRVIRLLPEPKPRFEIFVYSPRMEGIHLRGGRVARGGIRWSDRREDFRTEVLGLLKAQMVKNAVIVPVGAKGGFVVKKPPTEGGREALLAEGVFCYQTFIRGLLDLTDNLVKGEVVPPEELVRRDGDDTYLVVAADKGTAAFSDIANEVAAEYGFWLGDAFASGGSAGYDHKKMGITARGAWEAVKRHFRELGLDTQREPFTVVGVGDMSGDVFGNGMLLSPHSRLVAAFNHLHIFIDPAPAPRVSFEERRRLFGLPRSLWTDYNSQKISAGGGVYERSAKWIDLSAEVQGLLGADQKRMTPNELIQALLRVEVDLLWFGGIGTFVRAAGERNVDVGDRANDAVRVEASELRCRVVGEGANLGLTQQARIEFALAGGKLNTDAVDNSGGVDCSDHEVNIKIVLDAAQRRRKLSLKARNTLLDEMTEDVAALVLRDNYLQTQALSLAERRGIEHLDQQGRMIRSLERSGVLDRALEGLPDEEALAARTAQRRGLVRPELAVLLAYAKIALYQDLVASDLPDDPVLGEDLVRYFPEALGLSYGSFVDEHRLRREIIATFITNSTVNRVGPTFVYRLQEATGRPTADVARAYTIVRDAFDLRKIWLAIEALDNRVPAALQLDMLIEASRLTEHATLWFLRRYEHDLDVSRAVKAFRPGLRRLSSKLESLIPATARRELRRRAKEYAKQGAPERLAHQLAGLRRLVAGADIVSLAAASGSDLERVAAIYFSVGERFGIQWLRAAAARMRMESAWERGAAEALVDNLFHHQTEIAAQVMALGGGRGDIERWSERCSGAVDRYRKVVEEIRHSAAVDVAKLAVANQQLKLLVDGASRATK